MNIAFISYEYPPDTAGGGIGTYTQQVAELLASAKNIVYVFTATAKNDYQYISNGVNIFRLHANSLEEFRHKVTAVFSAVHHNIRFDVFESPEYGYDGYFVKQAFPDLPYVVKLHSPSYLIAEFNNYHRQYILPRKKWVSAKLFVKKILNIKRLSFYNYKTDIEYLNAKLADKIISPSKGLAKKISKDWKINFRKIAIVPNPYTAGNALDNIPLNVQHNRVTFIGKLSVLKGMATVVDALPIVLKKLPQLQFRFIGADGFSPNDNGSMKEFLLKKNIYFKKNIELTGQIPLAEIPGYLAQTDIVLCTSLWENYPTVILEAMSAGKIVIATNVGGIPEIITNNKNGFLIPAKNPAALAKKIIKVYEHKNIGEIKNAAKKFTTELSDGKALQQKIISVYQKFAVNE